MNTPVDQNPNAVVSPSAKPPRNPTERIAVWVGIGLLLAVVALEFRAQRGYAQSLDSLNASAGDEAKETTLAEARQLLALAPSVSAPVQSGMYDEYQCSWPSLFKSGQYQITLVASREKDPLLMEFRTPNPPPEPEPEVAAEGSGEASPSPMGGMGMGGGGMGMGGGGARRPNPVREALDADADGSLSPDEIAGSATALAKLDKDTDGSLSAEELTPPPAPAADAPAGGAPASATAGHAAGGAAAPAGPGGGPGGRGGGAPRPNRLVVAIDTNTDGALSAEELAAAPTGLKSLDADSDGTIAAEELRPPGGGGGGGGGGAGGGAGRSRRPASEETPAPTTDASPPAEKPAAEAPAPAETPAPVGDAATPAPATGTP